jgi:hypothetical protein
MGCWGSKIQDNVVEELREQIKELTIDRNNVIKAFIDAQKIEMEGFKIKMKEDFERQQHIETEAKYIEMQKQIDSLRQINKDLEQKLAQCDARCDAQCEKPRDTGQRGLDDTNGSKISKKQMDQFIENLLNDQNINITYLPDFVERQLYRNMFALLLGLIEKMAETTEIKILGHHITTHFSPDQLIDGD